MKHTSDVDIELRGCSPQELFKNSLVAMYHILKEEAYKDFEILVDKVTASGIAKKIEKCSPVVVIKG